MQHPTETTRVLLVTGGGRGIGRAVSVEAARRGWAVALTFRDARSRADETVEEIVAAGGAGIAVRAEVSDERDVIAAFDAAANLGPVMGVVNNAGIVAPALPLAEMSAERLRRVFDVNVFGAFLVAREAARRLSTSRGGQGGVIVNVSSAAARLGSPNEYIDYAASKGALDTLTLGLAKELGPEGVRVNAVRPGLIDTEIHASGGAPDRAERLGRTTPLGRAGTASEVADAILWLLRDESTYVTGALLDVSGGR